MAAGLVESPHQTQYGGDDMNTGDRETRSNGSRGNAKSAASSDCESQLWWEALTHDTDPNVAIVDYDGRFHFCNKAIRRTFGRAELGFAGLTWHDVMPLNLADERLRCTRHVLETRRPVALLGLLNGVYRCMVFRPLPSEESGLRVVLVVCPPVSREEHNSLWQVRRGYEVVKAQSHDLGPLEVLTPTELKVLVLIGDGMTTLEMAKELHRSDKTVERHRSTLGRKLGARNRVALAHIAIDSGLSGVDLAELCPPPRASAAAGSAQ